MRSGSAAALALAMVAALAAASGGADPQVSVGTGERLLIVIGGDFDSREEAVAAADAAAFGDVQGFYVGASDDFDGEQPGRWLLVSAFRTETGAIAFEELAAAAGVTQVRRVLTTYRGTEPIGLGQEADPSGFGPLLAPLPPWHPMRL